MKNVQTGFIGIIVVILIAVAVAAGGTYVYIQSQEKTGGEVQSLLPTEAIPSVREDVKVSNILKAEVKTKQQIEDYATAITDIDATISVFNSSLLKFNEYISFYDKLIVTLQNEITSKTRIGSDERANKFLGHFKSYKDQVVIDKQGANKLIVQYKKIRQSLTSKTELSAEDFDTFNTQATAKQNLQSNLERDRKDARLTLNAFDESFLIKALGNSYKNYIK